MTAGPVSTETEPETKVPDRDEVPGLASASDTPELRDDAVARERSNAALPSIMIDASLSLPEPAPASPPEPTAAPQAAQEAAAPAPPGAVDFDAAAADRFAAAYRPSWEPPQPTPGASVPAAKQFSDRPVLAASVAPAAIGVDEPIAPLKTKQARQRATLAIVGSVLGFFVLAYFAIASSSKAPPSATATHAPAAAPTTTQEAAHAEPSPTPPAIPGPDEAPTPAAAPEPTPTPTPTPTTAPAELAATPSAATIVTHRVNVTTTPRAAQLFLDELAVDNPFEAQLPEGTDHQLRALADGYDPATLSVHVSGDTRISLVLTRKPAPPTPKPAAVAPTPKALASSTSTRHRAPTPATTKPASKPVSKPKAKSSKGAGFVADSPY